MVLVKQEIEAHGKFLLTWKRIEVNSIHTAAFTCFTLMKQVEKTVNPSESQTIHFAI